MPEVILNSIYDAPSIPNDGIERALRNIAAYLLGWAIQKGRHLGGAEVWKI